MIFSLTFGGEKYAEYVIKLFLSVFNRAVEKENGMN